MQHIPFLILCLISLFGSLYLSCSLLVDINTSVGFMEFVECISINISECSHSDLEQIGDDVMSFVAEE